MATVTLKQFIKENRKAVDSYIVCDVIFWNLHNCRLNDKDREKWVRANKEMLDFIRDICSEAGIKLKD